MKRINLESKSVRLYSGISSITTILEKDVRRMWIGTRMGLYQLDKQSGIYQYIDLPSKGLSPREYQSVKQKVGFEALLDTKCRAYEALYMPYITPDAREEKLLEHPELFRTPIVRNGKEATVGYCPEIWQTWE